MSMPTNTNSRTPNQEKIRVGLRDRLPTTKLGGPHFYWICLFALVGYPRRFDSHGCGLPWCGAERVPPLSISCCTKKNKRKEKKNRGRYGDTIGRTTGDRCGPDRHDSSLGRVRWNSVIHSTASNLADRSCMTRNTFTIQKKRPAVHGGKRQRIPVRNADVQEPDQF